MIIEKLQNKVEKYSRRQNWTNGRRIQVELWKEFHISCSNGLATNGVNLICRVKDAIADSSNSASPSLLLATTTTAQQQQQSTFLKLPENYVEHQIELYKEVMKMLGVDNYSDHRKDSTDSHMSYQDTVKTIKSVTTMDLTLRESGKEVLNRLLLAVKHVMKLEYELLDEKVLSTISSLFLHHMREEEAFICLRKLLLSEDHQILFYKNSNHRINSYNNTIRSQNKNSNTNRSRDNTHLPANQNSDYCSPLDTADHCHCQNDRKSDHDYIEANRKMTESLILGVKKNLLHVFKLWSSKTQSKYEFDLLPVFDEWRTWLLQELPFSHTIYVLDCFLYEGRKGLFRILLALIKLWYKKRSSILKARYRLTCQEISADIASFCRSISLPPHKLLKVAFSKKGAGKMTKLKCLQPCQGMTLGVFKYPASDDSVQSTLNDYSALCLPHESNILSEKQIDELYSRLPIRYQLQNLTKIFSSDIDGDSFVHFWSKVENRLPTIILIRTNKGEIFGAFCSEPWSARRKCSKIRYFGTGETFLFKFNNHQHSNSSSSLNSNSNSPLLTIYPWVGCEKSASSLKPEEELFQAADETTLLIGGGGLSIRNSLVKGTSEHCATFNNHPLSVDIDFDIEKLEVLGFEC